jgi:hypothetical protein
MRWSPDGQELLLAAAIAGELGLWLMVRAGGFPRRVTTAPIALPFLASPIWRAHRHQRHQLRRLPEHVGGLQRARPVPGSRAARRLRRLA